MGEVYCPLGQAVPGLIRGFINGWNDRAQPFVWTKPADQILTKAFRKQLQSQTTSLGDC